MFCQDGLVQFRYIYRLSYHYRGIDKDTYTAYTDSYHYRGIDTDTYTAYTDSLIITEV